jgi:DNA-binding GntR family transcriptional regulator
MGKRRAEIIADQIQEKIFSGEFKNGMRLDEVTLAETFGVSRTPLREAFQRLAQSGLVELLPRRGAFVRQPGPIELMEMFEVMAELEATCARLAASRISDDALDKMRVANRKCQAAIDAKQPDAYYAENEVFHHILYSQSGNRFLRDETMRLADRLRPFRRQQLRLRGRMDQSMAEHEAIVVALEKGDADAAAQQLRSHVAVQGEKFHSLLSSLSDQMQD